LICGDGRFKLVLYALIVATVAMAIHLFAVGIVGSENDNVGRALTYD